MSYPNVAGLPLHVIVPVYSVVSVTVVTGIAPATGGATPGMAGMVIEANGLTVTGIEKDLPELPALTSVTVIEREPGGSPGSRV